MREGDKAFEALRQAIDSFGAERAQDLVAEARIEAAAKVRSMLAEAMAGWSERSQHEWTQDFGEWAELVCG